MSYPAIQTKFLGPTNFRGSRIKATLMSGNQGPNDPKLKSVTLSWDYAKNPDHNHLAAAQELLARQSWMDRKLIEGWTATGRVFVVTEGAE